MTKIVGTTTTGIIFSDASPKKPGESIAEYTERLINEAEEGEGMKCCTFCGSRKKLYESAKEENL